MKRKRKTGSGGAGRDGGPPPNQRRCGVLLLVSGVCLAVLCVFALPLSAKKKPPLTKTVQGEVVDASNRPIVGASVELTDETAGTKLGLYTAAGGRYEFTALKPNHDYKVQASYQGQASEVRHASSLDDRGIVVLNLTIPPPASP
ncbi:MAG TPA: carboxypeptidase-like regulatory domain-containing protein [Terriglobia bacterium]|nr:carboxypeptidase-like regulatory domain-containing protein [Terriglobia bacterium]